MYVAGSAGGISAHKTKYLTETVRSQTDRMSGGGVEFNLSSDMH